MKIPMINSILKQKLVEHVPGKLRVYRNSLGIGRKYYYSVTDLKQGTRIQLETMPDAISLSTNSKGNISIIDSIPTFLGKEIGTATWIETLKTETGKLRNRVKQGFWNNKIIKISGQLSI